jgi:hypothetical protein
MTKRLKPKVPLTAEQLEVRKYLTGEEVERVYNVPQNFLRDLRHGRREGRSPPFVRLGYRTILYGPREQIELWLAQQPGGGQKMIPVQQSSPKTRRGRKAAA